MDRQSALKAGWWGETPKTACNSVVSDLPFGSQVTAASGDLKCGKKLRFCSVHRRLDRSRECAKRPKAAHLANSNWQIAKQNKHLAIGS